MAAPEPIRSVYFGDVVSITPETTFAGRPNAWVIVAWAIALCVLGVLHFRFGVDWADFAFWPVAFFCTAALLIGAWCAVRTVRLRRRLDGIETEPAHNNRSIAWRLWHRALVERRGRIRFDARQWIEKTGPDGPRVILLSVDLPDISVPDDVTEEVPIGADGPIGREERGKRYMQLGLFGFNIILISTIFIFGRGARSGTPRIEQYFMVLLWGSFLLVALYRLGVRPVSLGASSAAPGMVRVTRGSSTKEFTRDDSVVVLGSSANFVTAWVFRKDGAGARFNYQSGAKDPGLRNLIERWCWRPTPTTTPTPHTPHTQPSTRQAETTDGTQTDPGTP